MRQAFVEAHRVRPEPSRATGRRTWLAETVIDQNDGAHAFRQRSYTTRRAVNWEPGTSISPDEQKRFRSPDTTAIMWIRTLKQDALDGLGRREAESGQKKST